MVLMGFGSGKIPSQEFLLMKSRFGFDRPKPAARLICSIMHCGTCGQIVRFCSGYMMQLLLLQNYHNYFVHATVAE